MKLFENERVLDLSGLIERVTVFEDRYGLELANISAYVIDSTLRVCGELRRIDSDKLRSDFTLNTDSYHQDGRMIHHESMIISWKGFGSFLTFAIESPMEERIARIRVYTSPKR